jgi:DNA-binding MarR family transcriptional regulator
MPADLARLLRDALRTVEREMLAVLEAEGFEGLRPGHMLVFRHLDPEGMSASALARDAGVTRQTASQAIAELDGLGIVEQVPDPGDRRAKLVRYTARGRRGFAIAFDAFDAIERRHAQQAGERAFATTLRVLREVSGPR